MIRLLTISSEYDSAARLGFSTHYRPDYCCVADWKNDIVVRWGNSGIYNDGSKDREFDNVVNTSKAISSNCHKRNALEKMSKVVRTPKMYPLEVPDGKLAVYRPYSHSAGSDFAVKKGPFKVDINYNYATEFIKTDTEFRVWFCGDMTLMARRVTSLPVGKYPCRSNWPYRFVKRIPQSLHRDVLLAAKAIGLELGAADVLYKNGKYYFLELNSAATCDSKHIIEFYKNGILKLCKVKFPEKFLA